jgi:hypothetical protein
MLNTLLTAAMLLTGFASRTAAHSDSLQWTTVDLTWCSISSTPPDSSLRPAIAAHLRNATFTIREAFGRPFPLPCSVYVFPSRATLDHYWRQAWGDSSFHSECRMVASGVAARLDILSPRVWNAEACEHSAEDSMALRALITHEMVHVFHAQYNPRPDFAGMDSLSWFIEGLATYISGQLTDDRLQRVRQLIAADKGPKRLSEFWTGEARYGNAGSLVRLIDRSYGRETIVRMLIMTDQREMLRELDTDEPSLIRRWEQSLKEPH